MGLPFASSYTKKRDQVVAIDLGAKTTKSVCVENRGGKLSLLDFTVADTPEWENCPDPSRLAEHLKAVSQFGGSRSRVISIALGVHNTFFKQVEVPLLPIPDLRLMLKYNSKTYLQEELADHVFDCQYRLDTGGRASESTKNPSQKFKAVVGAARKTLIEKCQMASKIAGLQLENVVPGVIGPANAFELAEPEGFSREVVALVDFGFRSTSITILESGEIALHRVLGIGGDRLTTGLAEALGISYPEAENIKVGMPAEVAQELAPQIHPLGRELRASIDYFENHHDKVVNKVLLSGGAAQNDLIVTTLQAELMIPCTSWWNSASLQQMLSPEKASSIEGQVPQLIVAIGAASTIVQ